MHPAGKWLSFDPGPASRSQDNLLTWLPPTDDDEILHRIMVRAAILASDETLASRRLLKQIRG